ncbi:deoxyribose-phosphate aldolase [Paenibacillus physcomitrellae]|uniref:Deoxyribose-phosphate aldolase n=1 Tax=Paenibacillus physcomitrellae TaxID=1619311 RepID=A0ABQ1GUT2_9BACL|nr:deoxyribose-phosphate aldolase [Paenibacillus physcomitrellae]GGA50363.1 deoxyribose-phosphate aldolase [Paenibacillus physcomitrellae]
MNNTSIASIIDHTLLKPEARKEDILKLAAEAAEYGFASVCVNPVWVATAAEALKSSPNVKVCTVIGFPLGASHPAVKAYETVQAVKDGADEIDMVINIGALKDGEDELVQKDIRGVVEAAGDKLVKVIIETCLLTKEEIERVSRLSVAAGAHFVKTSTGFSKGGATVEDVELMRQTVGPDIGVKASGGVRTTEDALAMIKAGASRLGTSGGVAIAQGLKSSTDY